MAPSRTQARELITSGLVTVGGAPAEKGSRLVAPSEAIEVLEGEPLYVGRGGLKLADALARLEIDVSGRRALDAGSSTGGFTDCLLKRGAAHVWAVDVGRAQLHERLSNDHRVTVRERTDVRSLGLDALSGEPVEVVVADLSFISLRHAVPVLAGPLATPGADLVLLVKPQFEAGRQVVSRGRGVVRDPAVWREALSRVASSLAEAGAAIIGAVPSSVTGARGNVEFFLHARAHSALTPREECSELLAAAVREAG
jgi:23S rRNA (cytidine1920-2'-O)/16S rRNA (cytidine1409-2'-O)-methyltransferase